MMNDQEDILSTGTLYWIKSNRRGTIPVPLEFLNEDQKQTLRSGLISNNYPSICTLEYETQNAHYIWEEKHCLYEVLVTDIYLSLEIKRKLSPYKRTKNKAEYRVVLSDMKRLKEEFDTNKIDEVSVRDILNNIVWRPWQYVEWRDRREKKIKGVCETCGETADLILQHTRQQRKSKDIIFDLIGIQYEELLKYYREHENEIELPIPVNIKKVPVCPKCGSSKVRHRMRANNYVCEKSRNYVKCKHEFTIPDYGIDERDIKQAEKKRRSLLRDRFCKEQGIYNKAAEISLKEIITYLEMVYVKTLCRKCAFIEDRTTVRLCQFCAKNYHPKWRPMCKECAKNQD